LILRLVAKFSLAQILVWTIPLMSAIALSNYSQASEWVGVSLGMAIGAAGGLFVSGGWSLQGASTLINDSLNRESIILRSSIHRTLSLVFSVPIFALICFVTYPPEFLVCFLSACATAAIGAGPRWYLSATGQVGRLVRLDIIPRAVAGIFSIVVILVGGSVLIFCLTVLVGQLAPIPLSIKDKKAWLNEFKKWNAVKYLATVRANAYSTAAEMIGAITLASPLIIASFTLDTDQNAEVATAFRIFGIALTATTILSNASQSASIIETSDKRHLVVKQNLTYSFFLASAGLFFISFTAIGVSSLLFPRFEVSTNLIFITFGVAFFSMTVATHFLRHIVLYLKMYREVLFSNLLALACCLFVTVFLHLTSAINIGTVAIPYAVAELVALIALVVVAKRSNSKL
jgi:hypothetical protein